MSRGVSSAVSPLSAVGLFSGIGGIELGLHRAGHHSVLLCESDPAAAEVLHQRFDETPLVGDIHDLDSLPAVDLVAAGFPCQDLSQAGRTQGIGGPRSSVVSQLFRLLGAGRAPDWVLIENVPFLLHLDRGEAMRFLVSELERLGYQWAYRVVDTMAFGLPQRRRRVWMLASKSGDPRTVLFADDVAPQPTPSDDGVTSGFYWTEGTRGLGWVPEGVPPLKGGSGLGILSPPAIWLPDKRELHTPDIRDAERLQGFDAGWTERGGTVAARWKLVGNAVSVPVAEWIGQRLRAPGTYDSSADRQLSGDERWPKAAWGGSINRFVSGVSDWPVARERLPLRKFLQVPTRPLSQRATAGFLRRAKASRLRFAPGFLEDVEHYLKEQRRDSATSVAAGE